jgi:hypothetical protein
MSPEILQIGRLSASGEARIRAALPVTLLAEQADPDNFLCAEGQ